MVLRNFPNFFSFFFQSFLSLIVCKTMFLLITCASPGAVVSYFPLVVSPVLFPGKWSKVKKRWSKYQPEYLSYQLLLNSKVALQPIKKLFLKTVQNWHENNCTKVSLSQSLPRQVTDSDTGVSIGNFNSFKILFIHLTPQDDYMCQLPQCTKYFSSPIIQTSI